MKNRYIAFIFLIGALVFLGIPSNILSANFETESRDIKWISNYDERVAGDFGGIYHDSIYTSKGTHIAVGLHTDVYDPNDATVNHYNGLITSFDEQGKLLNSLELKGPNGSKSYFNSVTELSNGNFIAVGVNHSGTIDESGKAVIFDSNLTALSSINFESTQNDYSFASFLDVQETSAGILISGSLTNINSEKIEMATFLFDNTLNLVEEVSHGNGFQGVTSTNLNIVLDKVVIGNINTNGSNAFILAPFQSGRIEANTQAHSLTQYDGYAVDAIVNTKGDIVILVALNDGTYRIRQFDSSLNSLSDLTISLQAATYTNIASYDGDTYVVSGEKNGKMHYVISDGVNSSEHTYDSNGIIENTTSSQNGSLVSVGYNYDSFFATVMKTSPIYTVSFNGGEEPLSIPNQEVFKGETVSKPSDPQGLSGSFLGWFSDEQLSVPYDFSAVVTKSMTLYAKWGTIEMILDHNGNIDPTLAPNDSVIWVNITRRSEIVWDEFQFEVAEAPGITPLGKELGVKFEGWELVDGDLSRLLMPGDIIDQTIVDIKDYPQGGNLLLKAVYSRPSYTVTIKDTVDASGKAYTVYHGEKLSTLNHTPLNDGFVFNGYTEQITDEAYDLNKAIIRDVTLIGNWTKVTEPLQTLESSILWVGGSEPRPTLNVSLYGNNKLIDTKEVFAGITNVSWDDLLINDENGNAIVYSVKAAEIDDYEITYNNLNVTLTYVPNVVPNPEPPVEPEQGNAPKPEDPIRKPLSPKAPKKETIPDIQGDKLPGTGISDNNIQGFDLVLLGGIVLVVRKNNRKKEVK